NNTASLWFVERLRRLGLGFGARLAAEEDHDLFVSLRSCVDSAMSAKLRAVPVSDAGMDRHALLTPAILELDAQEVSTDDDRETGAGIRMPGCGLAGLEDEPPNLEVVTSRNA